MIGNHNQIAECTCRECRVFNITKGMLQELLRPAVTLLRYRRSIYLSFAKTVTLTTTGMEPLPITIFAQLKQMLPMYLKSITTDLV